MTESSSECEGKGRPEQRLRMCKGCGGLGSKRVSICMGLVQEVDILSISDAVPVYLTSKLIPQLDLFYVLCHPRFYLHTFASTFFYKRSKFVLGAQNYFHTCFLSTLLPFKEIHRKFSSMSTLQLVINLLISI